MTPKEFHEACHEACQECPQFRYYDDDSQFGEWGEFGDIPKKGIVNVVKFWRENEILWEYGYSECLPCEVKDLFDRIDALLDDAIRKALGEKT